MSKETGGPAFPVTQAWDENFCDEGGYGRTRRVSGLAGGITMRDYFAAKAMQGLYAEGAEDYTFDRVAAAAYATADAMITERNKP